MSLKNNLGGQLQNPFSIDLNPNILGIIADRPNAHGYRWMNEADKEEQH